MPGVEGAEQRRDPGDADRIRRGETQPPAWTALQLTDGAFGFVQIARDALAMFEVNGPGFGQTKLARGAMQKLCAEACFQVLHLAADRGLGQSQCAGGRNKTSVLGDLDEYQCVVEIAGHRRAPEGWGD